MKNETDVKEVHIFGDVMLDTYWHGRVDRISPEAPVPILNKHHVERRLGGAANVAANLSALGFKVNLCGFIGDDQSGQILSEMASEILGNHQLIEISDHPTTNKIRALADGKQLLRIDEESAVSDEAIAGLYLRQRIEGIENKYVVISDYGKGVTDVVWKGKKKLIDQLLRQNNKLIVDPKGKDFEKYRNVFLLKPNLKEFEQVVGICSSQTDLENKARNLMELLELENLIVTRGGDGMSVFTSQINYHLSSEAIEVVDVTGAGDTVLANLTSALLTGLSVVDAAEASNRAAAQAVKQLGTAIISSQKF